MTVRHANACAIGRDGYGRRAIIAQSFDQRCATEQPPIMVDVYVWPCRPGSSTAEELNT